jgi:hypothetical protein
MADNVTPSPAGGTVTDKAKLAGVMDQVLVVLSDKVLNTETAVRENTAQMRVMASSVELVRGIPNKMETVEKRVMATGEVLDKVRERMDALEVSVRKSMDVANDMQGSMLALGGKLYQHAQLFEKPLEKSVLHRHEVGWPIFLVVGLILSCCALVMVCFEFHAEAGQNAASDIQWRAAQLITDSGMVHELQTLKQNYAANPDSVRTAVIAEEDRRAALAERIIERDQKIQEVDELKKQGKQR